MAKPLVLQFNGQEQPFNLKKIDRSILYGFVDTEILDEQKRLCRLVTLADDGRTLIGSGSITMATMSPDGHWRDKKELKAVDTAGQTINPVPSSFKSPIILDRMIGIDEYLTYNIRAFYLLTCEDQLTDLKANLLKGAIYAFPFSYRGGLDPDMAFLLASQSDLFMTLGKKTDLHFIGFEQTEVEDQNDDEEDMSLKEFLQDTTERAHFTVEKLQSHVIEKANKLAFFNGRQIN